MNRKETNKRISQDVSDAFFNRVRHESIQYLMPSRIGRTTFRYHVEDLAVKINREEFQSLFTRDEVLRTARSIASYQWKRRMAIRLSSPGFRAWGNKTRKELTAYRTLAAHILSNRGLPVEAIAEIIGKTPQTIEKYLRFNVGSWPEVIDSPELFKKVFKYRKSEPAALFSKLMDCIGMSYDKRTGSFIALPAESKKNLTLWSNYLKEKIPGSDIQSICGRFTAKGVLKRVSRMKGDNLLFLFAGHGDRNVMKISRDETLAYENLFTALKARRKPLIVIISACYSGSAEESFKKVMAGYPHNAVLVTSCGEHQYSYRDSGIPWILISLLAYDSIPEELCLDGVNCQCPIITRYDARSGVFSRMKLYPQYALKRTKRNLYPIDCII